MSKIRIHAFTISADGYGAGPDQNRDNPLGRGGVTLHEWMTRTRTFARMQGEPNGETGDEDNIVARGFADIGAWIMGRNMFGPQRGEWTDKNWRGWWGDEPPYQTDVFVLTHHPRDAIPMSGGTTFHFVTDGIHAALERATAAANGKGIRIGGGVNVIRQFLRAGLVDEMHFAISPVVLGSGEHLLLGIDLSALGYKQVEHLGTANALHIFMTR
jgi:dihydrofolate reductase